MKWQRSFWLPSNFSGSGRHSDSLEALEDRGATDGGTPTAGSAGFLATGSGVGVEIGILTMGTAAQMAWFLSSLALTSWDCIFCISSSW